MTLSNPKFWLERAKNEHFAIGAFNANTLEQMQAKPDLIKPNKHKFADVVGCSFGSFEEYTAATSEVATQYKTRVILSLGADGALAAVHSQFYIHVHPKSP